MGWENIFSNDTTGKRLVSKIYKELLKLNTRETSNQVKEWAEIMNRHFSNEDVKMSNRHMKKCSKSLAFREIQIKTTLRNHLTPVRMAKIDKAGNKCWRGCGERGSLLPCWWECKLVQPLWKTVWRILKKLKIEGHLGGTMVKCLPSAQGVIPVLWDRAPHQASPLGACFFLSHSPCLCSLSCFLSLSVT